MPFIKANRGRVGDFFWRNFSKIAIALRFHSFSYNTVNVDPKRSLLMIANHISWWDGFWAYALNDRLLGKKFHVMMLEQEVRKRMFLTRAGAFSVDPTSRSILETLAYARELLTDPDNMVLLFPQGRIHSLYDDDFMFEKGVDRMIGEDTQILLAAALVDYGSYSKPSITYSLQLMDVDAQTTVIDMEGAFRSYYKDAVDKHREKMKNLHMR